jgi:hypothetical protein
MTPAQHAIFKAQRPGVGGILNAVSAGANFLAMGESVVDAGREIASSDALLEKVNAVANAASFLPGAVGTAGRAIAAGTGVAGLAQHWQDTSALEKISTIAGAMSIIPGVGEVAFPVAVAAGIADRVVKWREQQKAAGDASGSKEMADAGGEDGQASSERLARQKQYDERRKERAEFEALGIAANEKMAAGDLRGAQAIAQQVTWMRERDRLIKAGAPEWQAQEGAGAMVAAQARVGEMRTAAHYARLVNVRSGGGDVARAAALSREQRMGSGGGGRVTHESLNALLSAHMAPLGHMSREQFQPRLKLGGS